jgi:ABC-type polar amino acid transport system ATPase subunit
MGYARKVAERVLFLEGGKIVEDSPSHEFFEPHPPEVRTITDVPPPL